MMPAVREGMCVKQDHSHHYWVCQGSSRTGIGYSVPGLSKDLANGKSSGLAVNSQTLVSWKVKWRCVGEVGRVGYLQGPCDQVHSTGSYRLGTFEGL
jgi:hypothetical protein